MSVHAGQRCRRLAQKHPVAVQLILVIDSRQCLPNSTHTELEPVIVAGRFAKLALRLGDHKENPAILQVAIPDPTLTKQLGPSHLEILEVFRVVHITHRIAFSIPNAYLDLT